MRLAADWLGSPSLQRVLALLGGQGGAAWIVGGAVRNALLGRAVTDIDIATSLRPEEVTARAGAAGLRVVPTGMSHGTVSVFDGAEGFEVTTLRRDVATDGRHAEVAFTASLAEDAARRDFTMNALYATAAGEVIDPVGGLADLRGGRVRFVGDAGRRLAEDRLRILRFFRFHAWYGDPSGGIDAEGLAACAAGADGLGQLSRERVGAELRKLLSAPDPAPAVAAMQAAGVLWRVVPGAGAAGLAPLVDREEVFGIPPRWLRRLAVLSPAPLNELAAALRLSRADLQALAALRGALERPEPPALRAERWGRLAALDALVIEAAAGGEPPLDWHGELERGAAARFPLSAADLMPPLVPGPALGAALERLREDWRASGLTLGAEALRARL